jgi:hypothetical protein
MTNSTGSPQAQVPALITRDGDDHNAPITITRSGLEVITEMAARGNSQATIAKHLGCAQSTLSKLVHDRQAVGEAWREGRGRLEDELVGHMLTLARKGNVAATIFALKSMCGYTDQPQPREDRGSNITINLPGAMSPEQYMRSITVEAADET